MGQHGIMRTVCLGEIVTFQIVVVRIQEPHHTVHRKDGPGRLEGVGLKNLSLSTKSKENVVKTVSPASLIQEAQMADTRLESTPPDRKVQMGIGDHLPAHGVLDQEGCLFNGFLIAVLMGSAFQFPVTFKP